MRWRIRFRLRLLMAVVAVVALVLWGETVRRRWVYFRNRAAQCARQEKSYLAMSEFFEHKAQGVRQQAEQRSKVAAYYRRMAADYASLKGNYERAASQPWKAIEPNPRPREETSPSRP